MNLFAASVTCSRYQIAFKLSVNFCGWEMRRSTKRNRKSSFQTTVKMATGVYKVIHGYKVPRGIGELLHERSTNYNLRGKHILELPKVNTTTYGLKSWRYTAAKIWNALPDQFRAAYKIGTFKNLMSKLDFSNFTF